MSDEVRITVKKNGSYRVEGPITLVDYEGNEYKLEPDQHVSLCRCGHSANKPFCDGTHKVTGFVAEETAPVE